MFITIMQEIVFSNLTIIVLPMLMGIDGIWYSFVAANILTFFVMIVVVYLNRDNYGYGSGGLALLIDR